MQPHAQGHRSCTQALHAQRDHGCRSLHATPCSVTASAYYKHVQATLWNAAGAAGNEAHTGLLQPLYDHIASFVVSWSASAGAGHTEAILDIACGRGEPSLAIAAALPRCSVLATDLAGLMIHIASRRASDMGLLNFRSVVADAEDLRMVALGSINVITCCAGLMFCTDHRRALREWRRVLAPSGRLIAAVTGRPEDMQVSDLVGPMLSPLRPKHRAVAVANPRPFGTVRQLLRDIERAGFSSVRSRAINVPMRIAASQTDSYVRANPIVAEVMQRLDTEEAKGIVQEAEAALLDAAQRRGYLQADGSILLAKNVYTVITATAQQ